MNKVESINIFGIKINNLTYSSFLEKISSGITNSSKLIIGYANADTLNKVYKNKELKNIYDTFDLIHPDGIGVFMASKFLWGKKGLSNRLTGSDFYPLLIKESIVNNWRYFFFGHSQDILENIRKVYPDLNICGLHEGYKYSDQEVIDQINSVRPDIIIVGLSCPVQERWIFKNKEKIDYKVILTVGEGIKVFAGKKIRGPVFLRKSGLEWTVRYLLNPVSNYRKYIIGVPLFIFRIILEKLKSK